MKIITALLLLLLTSSADGKAVYIGSTPANNSVKSFLGIPLSDSVDFIRWKLVTHGEQYSVHCDYGIGKPNTNGFIDKKTIDIKGKLTKEGNYYRLYNNNKTMLLAALNANVLHFANADKRFMTGNGGWSYNLYSSGAGLPVDIKLKQVALKDSMVFLGRTPCREIAKLGLRLSENCYKIKWSLILYTSKGKPTTYRTRGNIAPATGTWKIKNNMIILEAEHPVYFIMPDENILLFTDAKWNLLQGDEDFGYTLNRK
jgi:hypothetical protein